FFGLFKNRYKPIFELEKQIINGKKEDISVVPVLKISKLDFFEKVNSELSGFSSEDFVKNSQSVNLKWLDFFPKLARLIELASLIGIGKKNFGGLNSVQREDLVRLEEQFFENCGFSYNVNNLHVLSDYFYEQTKGLFGYISFDSFED